MGLLVACLAQQWFGDHRPYGASSDSYRVSSETIEAAQAEHRQASARLTLLREDRQKADSQRAQAVQERQKRDQAWKVFYTQPTACQNPTTSALFTACADDHIRAKREFDHAYATHQGMIPPYQSAVAANEQ